MTKSKSKVNGSPQRNTKQKARCLVCCSTADGEEKHLDLRIAPLHSPLEDMLEFSLGESTLQFRGACLCFLVPECLQLWLWSRLYALAIITHISPYMYTFLALIRRSQARYTATTSKPHMYAYNIVWQLLQDSLWLSYFHSSPARLSQLSKAPVAVSPALPAQALKVTRTCDDKLADWVELGLDLKPRNSYSPSPANFCYGQKNCEPVYHASVSSPTSAMLSCRNARCGGLHILLWARKVEPAYLSYFFHVWTMGSVACFGGMVFGIAGPGPSSQQSPEASRTSASLHRSHTACCQGGSFHQRSAPISDRSSSPLPSQLLEALQHDTRGGLNYPPRHPCNSAWHLLDDCSFCYSFLWRLRDARSSKSAGRSLHK